MEASEKKKETGKDHLSLARLRLTARDHYEDLGKINFDSLPEDCRDQIRAARNSALSLFLEMDQVIDAVVVDLEQSETELKKSSKKILGRVSEQLDKVTESTQIAVSCVLDRIDRICERQNTVFQQIAGLKERLAGFSGSQSAEPLLDGAGKIEELENEIQAEIYEIMNEMQFQDITNQQIQLANQLVGEARFRLMDFRKVLAFLTEDNGLEAQPEKTARQSFDPGATMKDRQERQSLADRVSLDFEEEKSG
jgi:chemotaxis regulatin CheY-phosphate phosphatase CheZ